jgi:hypothetical protein
MILNSRTNFIELKQPFEPAGIDLGKSFTETAIGGEVHTSARIAGVAEHFWGRDLLLGVRNQRAERSVEGSIPEI